jgi:hypothetical protein
MQWVVHLLLKSSFFLSSDLFIMIISFYFHCNFSGPRHGCLFQFWSVWKGTKFTTRSAFSWTICLFKKQLKEGFFSSNCSQILPCSSCMEILRERKIKSSWYFLSSWTTKFLPLCHCHWLPFQFSFLKKKFGISFS